MKTVVDERLVREANACALRHRCDDCVHFAPETERCAHGYPTTEHRTPLRLDGGAPAVVVFCKEFELA